MSQEDEMVDAMMNKFTELAFEYQVEEHYNHYGTRGVVDLVAKFTTEEKQFHVRTNLYEMKSEYAPENVTGANEIIRQCKRHAEYYYKDKGNPAVDNRGLSLVFYFSQKTHDHVVDNMSMYRSLYEQPVNGCEVEIVFYDPENDIQVDPLFVYDSPGEVSDLWRSLEEETDSNPFEVAGVEMR